ncbi:hypothetical protein AB4K20DRAFT_1868486 [Rhizopus microsporus]
MPSTFQLPSQYLPRVARISDPPLYNRISGTLANFITHVQMLINVDSSRFTNGVESSLYLLRIRFVRLLGDHESKLLKMNPGLLTSLFIIVLSCFLRNDSITNHINFEKIFGTTFMVLLTHNM